MSITLIAIALVFVIIGMLMYNGLISKKNKIDYALSSIDVMLKKRRDLIPNVVASVREYMTHERDLLTKVTSLRNQLQNGETEPARRFELEEQLGGALRQIVVAVENYPDLKADRNVLQLQASLNEVEEQISAARRAYNGAVYDYNNAIEMFPTNLMASAMRLYPVSSFEISEAERGNVDVSDLFQK